MSDCCAGIVTVIALSGQNQNPILIPGGFQGSFGDNASDILDHLAFFAARAPRRFFPSAYLLDSNDRQRHTRRSLTFKFAEVEAPQVLPKQSRAPLAHGRRCGVDYGVCESGSVSLLPPRLC